MSGGQATGPTLPGHLIAEDGEVKSDPFEIETPARLCFSGGRTSGYLLWRILQAFGGVLPDDLVVTFANTGREVEETLEFVRECGDRWVVKIRWVEYRRSLDEPTVRPTQGRKLIGCHGFAEVDFAAASREGEPFAAVIDVKADFRAEAKGEPAILPNPTDRWCSAELKARTMDRFMASLGYDEYAVVVGIRGDEAKRVAPLRRNDTSLITHLTPLVDAGVTLGEVMAFWEKQPFDLMLRHDPELGTYEGNCDLCFFEEDFQDSPACSRTTGGVRLVGRARAAHRPAVSQLRPDLRPDG